MVTDIRLIDMRSQMIDRGKGRYSREVNRYKTIGRAWHHTAVMTMRKDATEDEERNHVRMIDQFHYGKGWGGFGYNGIIFSSGRAYWCGDWDGARAHVASRNHELDGICFAGLFVGREPTPAALAGARLLRDLSVTAHGELTDAGHGDWALPEYPSACPGDQLGAVWIPKIGTATGEIEEDDMAGLSEKEQQDMFKYIENINHRVAYLSGFLKGSKSPSQKILDAVATLDKKVAAAAGAGGTAGAIVALIGERLLG